MEDVISHRIIGTSPRRFDAAQKAAGGTLYTADMKFPNLLHMKVLRSPHAHARICDIDVRKAKQMPGVLLAASGADMPGPFGVAIADQYPLAREKTRYAGEPVAVVVADTEEHAELALEAIRVTYEPLPFVLEPWQAFGTDAPVLHEKLMEYKAAPYVFRKGRNIFQHFKVRKGEARAALAGADCVVEGEFYYPPFVHNPLEPHCAVALYSRDGSMTMYATTQAPFIVQTTISELLEIPLHKIKVTAAMLGGGFGGKSDVTIEPLVACTARLVPDRYVRLLLTREEMFCGVTHGRNACCRYKMGFDKNGKLLAIHGESALGAGGNADYAVNIVTGMGLAGSGPYKTENLSLDVYGVYTNAPPTGAARGYGHPEVHLAVESLMDIAAEKLGIRPDKLREINLLQAGDVNGIGQTMREDSGNVAKCERVLREKLFDSPKPSAGPNQAIGRGMAAYMKTPCMPSNAQSGAFIKLNADGSITVSVGAVDMGQGLHTTMAQIAAEALDLPLEKVGVNFIVDTLISPYDWQTVASRTTWGSGNAVLLAAQDLRQQLREQAALAFGVNSEQVEITCGEVKCKGKTMDWGQFATGLRSADGSALTRPVMGHGYFVPSGLQNPDAETGQGNAAADWTFGCAGAEVAVDTRTGEITVLRLINVIDAGTIINPHNAREQVIGGMIMAAGTALTEKVVFDGKTGAIRNMSLVDYKIPGIEDIPAEIEVIFVQTPDETGPYGAKGLGEHGAVGIAPALLNAIYDAVGLRFSTLPVTAECITGRLGHDS
jgi:CO/xanthine dehydrogenase Mo-binding subunit